MHAGEQVIFSLIRGTLYPLVADAGCGPTTTPSAPVNLDSWPTPKIGAGVIERIMERSVF